MADNTTQASMNKPIHVRPGPLLRMLLNKRIAADHSTESEVVRRLLMKALWPRRFKGPGGLR